MILLKIGVVYNSYFGNNCKIKVEIDMIKDIISKLGFGLITLWVIVSLTFFLMHSLPGDPFAQEHKIPAKIKARMEAKYHLNEPMIVQYGYYMAAVAKGDLGISMKIRGRKVNKIISSHFPKSLVLGLIAIGIAFVFGTALGIIAGFFRGKYGDNMAMIIAIIGVSVPSFILAGSFQWVVMTISNQVGYSILPIAGYGGFDHLILPSIALSLMPLAVIARMMRASVIEVLAQDYIRTARAKGISNFNIIVKHVIRNAIMPVITYLGPLFAGITTGSFVIESVFAIPGLGKYFIESIQNRDYTIVIGVVAFYAALLIVMIMLVNLVYGFIDPRIRRGKGAE